MKIQEPNVSGLFYPENKKTLSNDISNYLQSARGSDIPVKRLRAIVVPHAGYIYSGKVAACAYKLLGQISNSINRIILIGPSHRYSFDYVAISTVDKWRTPLGDVKVDNELVEKLGNEEAFKKDNEKFFQEHSLEIQFPFLQTVLNKFSLVALCTGQNVKFKEIGNILFNEMDDQTLLVISSDLSHFLPYNEAKDKDAQTIKAIFDGDYGYFDNNDNTACGEEGIRILLSIAKDNNWKSKLIEYKNSGDITGDKERVVGYASMGFYV